MFSTVNIESSNSFISKEDILSKVSEEEIFRHYLNVEIQYKKLICSPLRDDKSPTCRFKQTDKGLYFQDFSGHFNGDCIDLVRFIYSCNFKTALQKIATDFNLHKFSNTPRTRKAISITPKVQRGPRKFEIKQRPWHQVDKDFWTQFYITQDILRFYNVYPIQTLWIDEIESYYFAPYDPAYAYYFGQNRFKIYFPYRDSKIGKFKTNCYEVQGWTQLDLSSSEILITKSLKDVMTLNYLGFQSCAPPSEGSYFPEWLMDFLNPWNTTVFYDNDTTGIRWANLNSEKYNVPYIYLPTEEKDPSDLIKEVGPQETLAIIKQLLNKKYHAKESSNPFI